MLALRTADKIALVTFCTRFHLYIHAYSLILQGRNLTLTQIAAIESVVIAAQFLMEIPTGIVADRIGRRWSVIASVFLMMCGELIFLFSREYWQYLFLAFITGTGFAFNSGASEALIYDSLPDDTNRDDAMRRAMGRIGASGQIAFFLSPIVGGLLLDDLAPERISLAIGLTVGALVIGVLIALTLRENQNAIRRTNLISIIKEGIGELQHNRNWRRLLLFAALTTPFGGTLITTLAAPYLNQNDVPVFGIGLALSIGSLLAAFTQANAHRIEKRFGTWRSLLLLSAFPGLLYLGAAGLHGHGAIAAWSVIVTLYAFNDMRESLFSAAQNRLLKTDSRATALSLGNMLFSVYIALLAPIYASLGMQAFVVMGSVILVATLALRKFAKEEQWESEIKYVR